MHVQLRTIKQLSINGHTVTKYPGDWIGSPDVGKELMLRWLAAGEAWIPDYQKAGLIPPGAGVIVLKSGAIEQAQARLKDYDIIEDSGGAELPFRLNLFWGEGAPLHPNVLPVGFHLLDTWHMAIPMWDYRVIAAHVGTNEEREYTRSIIRDLRVPLYHPGLIFIRRCEASEQFMAAWRAEIGAFENGDSRLALLRAIYRTKPLLLALPFHWTNKDLSDGYA